MRTLYTLLYIHLLPFLVLRLYWRSLKAPAYRERLRERFALIPRRVGDEPLIWVHAVSVGEVMAATPMVKAMMVRYPDARFCITTTTPTGSERVRAAFGDTVLHYYLPFDLPSMLTIFVKALRPKMLVIMETELWPNLLVTCEHFSIPVVLANGRLSARSAARYRRIASLAKPMFGQLSLVAAQSQQDAVHFIELGAKADAVTVSGSIKYDLVPDDDLRARAAELAGLLGAEQRKLLVFASTHPGEDELILPMLAKLHQVDKALLTVIVPRHPERFSAVARLIQQQSLTMQRLSEAKSVSDTVQVLLGDTMGDMLALFGCADLAFVGGSLIHHGGHNVLEPVAWEVPVLTGPHVFNFRNIVDDLSEAGGITVVQDIAALEEVLEAWLADSSKVAATAQKAQTVLARNQGAMDRLLAAIDPVYQTHDPENSRSL